MLTDEDFLFLSEVQGYGEIGVGEFLYLLGDMSDYCASFLKKFFNEQNYLNGLDKFTTYFKSVNIAMDSEISIVNDLRKFFNLFPLADHSKYASTSLLYYLITSNNSQIRNAFAANFQKFFLQQENNKAKEERKNAAEIYNKLKEKLETSSALGNLIKKVRLTTESSNRDKNIEYAKNYNFIKTDQISDEYDAFIIKLNQTRKNKITAQEISKTLQEKVIGQDDVCNKMGEILFPLVNNFSLLQQKRTPIARMLFCGPSGTGKTLLSQTIAKEFFDTDVLLIPCSQYQDSISANRLFGSTPGYVGYDDDTQLQTYLRNLKKSGKKGVIILDELEKMHPAALNSLLTALDGNDFTMHAKNVGNEKFNLKNCLIIGTSNLASDELGKGVAHLGFETKTHARTEQDNFALIKSAAQKTGISTEFFNRFENVFSFKKLTEDDYKTIAKKHCEKTLSEIATKLPRLKVKISETAIKFITELAVSQGENTRVIENMSTDVLANTIANYLITHENSENNTITISVKDNGLSVVCNNSNSSNNATKKASN